MIALGRRPLIGGGLALALLGGRARAMTKGTAMFGMIGKMKAQPGQRSTLIEILASSTTTMPGCLSYIVAEDADDPDGLWITEIWDSKASHDASLQLPEVREAIAKARPLIAGFETSVKTRPVAGVEM
ncbi:MAG TPA: putative quinol monooxygenase [Sphingomonas sp.]|nr:putative quinol monooxygenase [Sphingomonas sp.]